MGSTIQNTGFLGRKERDGSHVGMSGIADFRWIYEFLVEN